MQMQSQRPLRQRLNQADRLTADRLTDRYLILSSDLQAQFQDGLLDQSAYAREAERLRARFDREMHLVGKSTRAWAAPPRRNADHPIDVSDRVLMRWALLLMLTSAFAAAGIVIAVGHIIGALLA